MRAAFDIDWECLYKLKITFSDNSNNDIRLICSTKMSFSMNMNARQMETGRVEMIQEMDRLNKRIDELESSYVYPTRS